MSDPVEHPKHYTSHPSGVECITVTEHMNFNLGNATKYIWRAGLKSSSAVEDIRKARWYLDRELSRLGHVDAVEAIAAPVGAPVARVFNVGDPEPADKETIALSGSGVDGDVRIEYGDYGPKPHGVSRWWARRIDSSDNTHAAWSYWLSNYGQLTEVIGTPVSEPREFERIEDIPDDINEVRDVEGDYWERDGVDNPWNWPSAEDGDDKYAPFTEVL
ncbi:DUF3310 domain-containing protein [Rhodococcoides fascians]|uniref:DUF3310 domain-containing protein n=1 Tax=Rhodococcoides fascians TaxID=1828 RepID=UPI0009B84789|nr:DUF3310 domain-containing protein [Rhodococcus fascians]